MMEQATDLAVLRSIDEQIWKEGSETGIAGLGDVLNVTIKC